MFLQLGGVLLREGNHERAIELFKLAQDAIPFRSNLHLTVISLVSQCFQHRYNSTNYT